MAEHQIDPDYLARWDRIARSLAWTTPYHELFVADPPYHRWFEGGHLNLSVNCLDRHLGERGDQVAVYWEGEPDDRRRLTYAALHAETVRLAAALRDMGVERGDRVALHLGWLPETVVAMLACARIGAEYTVIPVTLPVEALALRLEAFAPRVLFTQDGGWRHGTILPLKARADEALEATSGVQHTVVVRRTGMHVEWFEGDLWYADVVASADPLRGEPASLDAGHPVVTVHLANRRGRPVAIRHGAGHLAVTSLAIHQHGLADGEVFWCAGDLAWLGAQAHGVIGPLLAGSGAVMYEGTLDVPDPARTWRVVARYRVSSLVTSPSIVRALRGWSLTAPSRSTRSLRRVSTIGEPLDDDVRSWLVDALGPSVTVADGWGQLELGGVVVVDQPVSSSLPRPRLTIVDDRGAEVPTDTPGHWVMRDPWPGTMRAAEVDGDEDPTEAHWTRLPGGGPVPGPPRRGGLGVWPAGLPQRGPRRARRAALRRRRGHLRTFRPGGRPVRRRGRGADPGRAGRPRQPATAPGRGP
jgi:acetyl-CoA synthetase